MANVKNDVELMVIHGWKAGLKANLNQANSRGVDDSVIKQIKYALDILTHVEDDIIKKRNEVK